MRTAKEMAILRERAIQLRRQGKSRRQIKEILGPMGNSTLDQLSGASRPRSGRRARRKGRGAVPRPRTARTGPGPRGDRRRLGVAKSSVSLWVRHLARRPGSMQSPGPGLPRVSGATGPLSAPSGRLRGQPSALPPRASRRADGPRDYRGRRDRLLVRGREEQAGTGPIDRVRFVNSDPALIRFFLRFLDATGTPRTRLRLPRLHPRKRRRSRRRSSSGWTLPGRPLTSSPPRP